MSRLILEEYSETKQMSKVPDNPLRKKFCDTWNFQKHQKVLLTKFSSRSPREVNPPSMIYQNFCARHLGHAELSCSLLVVDDWGISDNANPDWSPRDN